MRLTAGSGILLQASAGRWGTSGSNGGDAALVASDQDLIGDVLVDAISTVVVELTDGSTLTGAVNTAAIETSVDVTLDDSSTWTLTADSYVTTLDGADISGSDIANIVGNGFNVYYAADGNPTLGGRTYQLAGGGSLLPA